MRPLTPAQAALVAENVDLAFRMARRPQRENPSRRDQIESDALLGLIRAAARFDPRRSGNFRMMASFWIQSAISNAIRVRGNEKRRKVFPLVESDAMTRDPSPESAAVMAEVAGAETARFERLLEPLAGPLAEACRGVYARGETEAQIARRIGVSPDASRRLRGRALAILRGSRPSPRIAEAASCPS